MANRLSAATSPYLLQHADNPVDWWEWGEDAFAEARRRGVPVFLSVGYAACHWCHVMAHESFEDDATASQLNDGFVCVKVDREERPDVDAVYMEATVAMTGHGGWPMTVVARPRRQPLLRRHLLPRPAARRPAGAAPGAHRPQRGLDRPARRRTPRRHDPARPPRPRGHPRGPAPDGRRPRRRCGDSGCRLRRGARRVRGCAEVPAEHGAGAPAPAHRRRPRATCWTAPSRRWPAVASTTSSAGGFARYSVDAGWVVPHFEKMLYDNAQLVGLYARWGTPLGDRVSAGTAEWMLRGAPHARGRLRLGARRRQRGRGGPLLRLDATAARRRARHR